MKRLTLLLPILWCTLCLLWGRPADLMVVPGQPEFPIFWRSHGAGVEQNLLTTSAYLDVENVSLTALDGAIFYGEYFDGNGRFCFSSLFSQERNPIETGPLDPGKTRRLYAASTGIFPAAEPRQVRVYLLQQMTPGQPGSLRSWKVPIHAPAILGGSVAVDQSKIQLGTELSQVKTSPVVDVALAELLVDQKGLVENVMIIHSLSKGVESWLREFVLKQRTFYPALNGDAPTTDRALVLVRAVLSDKADDQRLANPPDRSEWVSSYAAEYTGSQVPPVTEFLLRLPATRVYSFGDKQWKDLPPAPSGLFELMLSADWSSPAVIWSADSSASGQRRMTF